MDIHVDEEIVKQSLKKIETYAELPVAQAIIASMLIFLGSVLCIFGKHIHKSFLAITGFLTGSLICFLVVYAINAVSSLGKNYDLILLISAPISGLVGGAVFLVLWKISLFGIGVVAGIVMSFSLYYIKAVRYLLASVPRVATVMVMTAIAVGLIFIYEVFFVILFTAVAGSSAVVIGIDMFAHTGLIKHALHYIHHPRDNLVITEHMQILLYVYGSLVSASLISQMVLSRRRRQPQKRTPPLPDKRPRVNYDRVDDDIIEAQVVVQR